MENIEFLSNADLNRWKDVVRLTREHSGRILPHEDFNRWNDGFGKENFNLLVAVNKETKETVGCVATAFYKSIDGSEPLVTLGTFFIVPEFRGIGLGLELFDRVLSDPRFKNINWGINGVPEMTKKYANRYGFDKYLDWQVAVFDAAINDIDVERLESNSKVKTINFEDLDFDKFIQYDVQITNGVRRDGFIKKWIQSKNSYSKIGLNSEGKIIGICNIRAIFGNQFSDDNAFGGEHLPVLSDLKKDMELNYIKIGPFYAESAIVAETLLKETLKSIPNLHQTYKSLLIFPSSTNKDAKDLFYKLANDKVVDRGVIFGQFTKKAIHVDPSKIYSITEYAMSYC